MADEKWWMGCKDGTRVAPAGTEGFDPERLEPDDCQEIAEGNRGPPIVTAGCALGDYWAYWLGGVATHRFRENIHPLRRLRPSPPHPRSAAPRRTPDSRSRTYAPSSSGSTASEPLRESALRRDVAYGDHENLVEEFRARVRAQNVTPSAMRELTSKYTELKEALTVGTHDLAKE
ncbi:hypothetical protein [Streptomyces sp. Ncost-T10-10d]|uniref:hypothetical protein n=1 Tax=Streptomyces sp. Ncost-T10-10d TaxID=1839774 RepID=UPI00081F46DE|nr:hypothetical protein [Streptomyces sp. Ncost-T10-10d]SCF98769.1 hypothetical protein GA0115254_131546 [Streptomyces sp. Ncost-T10-10d]